MNPPPTKAPDPWQELLTSTDIFSDICDIYSAEFFADFARHFNKDPQPFDLFQRVVSTAHAYVTGKWEKQAEKAKLLQYSGVHLIGAGLSARRLSYELSQLTKSKRASQNIHANLLAILQQGDTRSRAMKAYKSATFRSGPETSLTVIQELASALEEAIGQIIALPLEYDEEPDAKQRALDFVVQANEAAQLTLPKNHAVEEAARAFQPLWEEFSSLAYQRGRYHHEIGGYDCKPGNALFAIISKLDSTVAPSLVGTAIENLRTQSKGEKRSD
jgi:hypothetical protein